MEKSPKDSFQKREKIVCESTKRARALWRESRGTQRDGSSSLSLSLSQETRGSVGHSQVAFFRTVEDSRGFRTRVLKCVFLLKIPAFGKGAHSFTCAGVLSKSDESEREREREKVTLQETQRMPRGPSDAVHLSKPVWNFQRNSFSKTQTATPPQLARGFGPTCRRILSNRNHAFYSVYSETREP